MFKSTLHFCLIFFVFHFLVLIVVLISILENMPFDQNQLDDSISSNSSLDTTVSRMIGDENIIDSFFHICDIDHQGTVAASKLIDFVVNTIDSNIQV